MSADLTFDEYAAGLPADDSGRRVAAAMTAAERADPGSLGSSGRARVGAAVGLSADAVDEVVCGYWRSMYAAREVADGTHELRAAASRNEAEAVRAALTARPDVAVPDDLMLEVAAGLSEADTWDVLTALLAAGANPNARDELGRSVLVRVVRADQPVERVQALLDRGADPHAADEDGLTAADHRMADGAADDDPVLVALRGRRG